jgi:predicted DNA-binding transcriptional regulator YafY
MAQTEAHVAPLAFSYRNWRGETSERRVIPGPIWYGSTQWHHEPQWLLNARELDKGEQRDFAFKDIGAQALTARAS